jgi:hypothetical protein
MATTATLDPKTNILTVVTDQSIADVQTIVGVDTAHTPLLRNPIQVTGATVKLLTNDAGFPKTTATFQLS